MAATVPTRIDDDLFAAAKSTGARQSRSAAQQINHWARLGRQLEASSGLRQRDIARVLAGRSSYDTLGAGDQAVVRAEWDERMDATRAELDLSGELAASGADWFEADVDGSVVTHRAGGPTAADRRRTPPTAH